MRIKDVLDASIAVFFAALAGFLVFAAALVFWLLAPPRREPGLDLEHPVYHEAVPEPSAVEGPIPEFDPAGGPGLEARR